MIMGRIRVLLGAAKSYVSRLRAILAGRSEILVLGDSHARIFRRKELTSKFPKLYFDVLSVGGATISGINNPNSKTQALPRFRKKISKSGAEKVILILGEVDVGFVIWLKRGGVEKSYRDALRNYYSFVGSLSDKFSVICISVPLPTIKDEARFGEVANARKEVTASQMDRTRLTVMFNNEIEEFCVKNGHIFINLDPLSSGEDGLVDRRLLNVDETDHHYNDVEYARLLVDNLKH